MTNEPEGVAYFQREVSAGRVQDLALAWDHWGQIWFSAISYRLLHKLDTAGRVQDLALAWEVIGNLTGRHGHSGLRNRHEPLQFRQSSNRPIRYHSRSHLIRGTFGVKSGLAPFLIVCCTSSTAPAGCRTWPWPGR